MNGPNGPKCPKMVPKWPKWPRPDGIHVRNGTNWYKLQNSPLLNLVYWTQKCQIFNFFKNINDQSWKKWPKWSKMAEYGAKMAKMAQARWYIRNGPKWSKLQNSPVLISYF